MNNLRHGKFPKIKDVLPLVDGIWGHVTYDFPEYMEISKPQLDYLFMASYGMKNPAPVIDLLHEDPFSRLTDAEMTQLADMMVAYYKPKWDKLAEVYNIEYDPIHNYLDQWEDESDDTRDVDVAVDRTITDRLGTTVTHTQTRTDNLVESTQYGKKNTRTDNLSESTQYGKTNTETDNLSEVTQYGKTDLRTDNLSKHNTGTEGTVGTNNNTNSVWGFNSGNAVNSDASSGGNNSTRTDNLTETNTGTVTDALSGTDTTNKTGTVTDVLSGTDTVSKTGTVADTLSGTDTTNNTGTQSVNGSDATTGANTREVDETNNTDESGHRERSGKHFGNIGNLTSQKMIKEEIELWKWSFIQSILEDARDFLTLSVYM